MKVKSLLRNVAFVLIAMFVFFICAEAIQRFRHPEIVFKKVYNFLDFRGPEISINKSFGTKRILFVGASTTFGFFNPVDKTFPYFTEEILNKELDHGKVESINAAMPGRNSLWMAQRIEQCLYLNPDIVVVLSGYNDSSTVYGECVVKDRREIFIIKTPLSLKLNSFLCSHSALYITVKEKLALLTHGNPAFAYQKQQKQIVKELRSNKKWFDCYPQFYRENIETMILVTASHGVRLVFLSAPLSETRMVSHPLYAQAFFALKKELLEAALKFDVPVIELQDLFPSGQEQEDFISDGIHFTDKGNLKIAQAIAKFLLNNKSKYLTDRQWKY